jgi:hypothetical protein
MPILDEKTVAEIEKILQQKLEESERLSKEKLQNNPERKPANSASAKKTTEWEPGWKGWCRQG